MAVNVNPPPHLKIPKQFLTDPQVVEYLRQTETIIFQLWNRTGGNNDLVGSIGDAIAAIPPQIISPAHLFSQQVQIDEASDRIEVNEIDLATRPRMSDLFKTNQRIDELIDELIEQNEKLLVGSEAQQESACLQVQILKQMKLLNLRTEEAFNTRTDEGDIE